MTETLAHTCESKQHQHLCTNTAGCHEMCVSSAVMVSASSCLCVVLQYIVSVSGGAVCMHACMHHMCVCIVLQSGGWGTMGSVYCMSGSGCNSWCI